MNHAQAQMIIASIDRSVRNMGRLRVKYSDFPVSYKPWKQARLKEYAKAGNRNRLITGFIRDYSWMNHPLIARERNYR